MKWKKRKRKGSIDLDNLQLIDEPQPAKTWANLFFMYLFRSNLGSFTLKKSEGIPSIPLLDELPEGELDFDKIINRLKIMSGLDPVTFKKPCEGKIPLTIQGVLRTVNTTFIDSDNDSKCDITISEKKA